MNNNLLIIGAGAQGRITQELANLLNYNSIEFLDDTFPIGTEINGSKIVGGFKDFTNPSIYKKQSIVVALGDTKIKKKLYQCLISGKYNLPSLIHPGSSVSKSSKIGKGVFINNFTSIFPNSEIGDYIILDNHSSIGVDCKISSNVFIGPGVQVNSKVCIGEGSFIGAGAVILPGLKIGNWSVIGANSTVTKSVESRSTVVGSPAKDLIY